ncbi:hypothetical protein MPRM_54930 [Mycobacterium parmense]|uniref:Uncharacterized protein n=1 Tax=Mycobacterium parmense TaxID=185642 RepID=A0A7I7Z3G3_9MYCO|nr:hypothetical protein MPRM_54930 [Mycobacterium parmense]
MASISWVATEVTTRARLRGNISSDTKHMSQRGAGREQGGGRLPSRFCEYASAASNPNFVSLFRRRGQSTDLV